MLETLVVILSPIVVLGLLALLFRFLGMGWHALTAAVVVYLAFGSFVAVAQTSGGGMCESWRTGDYWQPVINWPGDIYANVLAGDISFRRYFIPRTCEEQR